VYAAEVGFDIDLIGLGRCRTRPPKLLRPPDFFHAADSGARAASGFDGVAAVGVALRRRHERLAAGQP
jgi:hypothetical protein